MSKQVVKDIQEALLREITTLATHVQATKTNIQTETTFDVFTGEALPVDIEGNLWNESSSPNEVEYPRVDLEYVGLREDRESGRMISIWEDLNTEYRELIWPNQNRPAVYNSIVSGVDGQVTTTGFKLPAIKFARVNSSYLVKIISGTNTGTYRIASLDSSNTTLILDTTLVEDIQELSFNESTRKLYLLNPTDLYSVRAGDTFVDSLSAQWKILHVNTKQREIYLDGSGMPSLDVGSAIIRAGVALKNYDPTTVAYVVMDPSQPKSFLQCPTATVTDAWDSAHPATPFDYSFTLEIKNKDQRSHISMVDQITGTIINRPRRSLKIVLREDESAESEVLEGPDTGWGQSVTVKDAKKFVVNDSVWVLNKYSVSENNQIIDVDYATNTLTFRNKVPIQYSYKNKAIVVSNARIKTWGMLLNNDDVNIGQDNINNFYRQEYTFRIQGYKSEKSGVKISSGITGMELTLESVNHVEDILKVP
jgi:hypothetical protein